jgi:hypothetical protein
MVSKEVSKFCMTLVLMIIVSLSLLNVGLFRLAHAESSTRHPVYSKESSGFKRLLIYYGWLNTGNVETLNIDMLVAAGTERILPGGDDHNIIEDLRSRGGSGLRLST